LRRSPTADGRLGPRGVRSAGPELGGAPKDPPCGSRSVGLVGVTPGVTPTSRPVCSSSQPSHWAR
jgi:hypothetical protein